MQSIQFECLNRDPIKTLIDITTIFYDQQTNTSGNVQQGDQETFKVMLKSLELLDCSESKIQNNQFESIINQINQVLYFVLINSSFNYYLIQSVAKACGVSLSYRNSKYSTLNTLLSQYLGMIIIVVVRLICKRDILEHRLRQEIIILVLFGFVNDVHLILRHRMITLFVGSQQ